MRNMFTLLHFLPFVVIGVLVLPGCSEPPTAPAAESDDFLAVTPALGKLVANAVIHWSVPYLVPCANGGVGEVVQTNGNVHFLRTIEQDAGGGYHGTIHTQAMNITGVGLTTGDVYQANGLFREQINFGSGASEFEGTYVNSFTLIGPGKDNNLQVQVTIHLTVSANGEVTADVDIDSMECR